MSNHILIAALTKVIAKQSNSGKKKTSKKLTLYRGLQDIYPSQTDPRYEGEGVFGRGTYYGFYYEDALGYAKGHSNHPEQFGIVMEYDVTFSNLITLHEEEIEGLESAGYKNELTPTKKGMRLLGYEEEVTLTPDQLLSDIEEVGHDGVAFRADNDGVPDGGEQLLIPRSSKVKPNLKAITYIFPEEEIASDFAKKMKLKVKYGHEVAVPLAQNAVAEKILRSL
jgi:hypothetical protein